MKLVVGWVASVKDPLGIRLDVMDPMSLRPCLSAERMAVLVSLASLRGVPQVGIEAEQDAQPLDRPCGSCPLSKLFDN